MYKHPQHNSYTMRPMYVDVHGRVVRYPAPAAVKANTKDKDKDRTKVKPSATVAAVAAGVEKAQAQEASTLVQTPCAGVRPTRALVVGVDYAGTPLCIPDCSATAACALAASLQGDGVPQVRVITEKSPVQPSRANIVAGMLWLTDGATADDVLLFVFFGRTTKDNALHTLDYTEAPLEQSQLIQPTPASLYRLLCSAQGSSTELMQWTRTDLDVGMVRNLVVPPAGIPLTATDECTYTACTGSIVIANAHNETAAVRDTDADAAAQADEEATVKTIETSETEAQADEEATVETEETKETDTVNGTVIMEGHASLSSVEAGEDAAPFSQFAQEYQQHRVLPLRCCMCEDDSESSGTDSIVDAIVQSMVDAVLQEEEPGVTYHGMRPCRAGGAQGTT